MKESIASFEARTGVAYDPPLQLAALGRLLRLRESCPTLYRYPGPHGLAQMLRGDMRGMASLDRPFVWLAENPRAGNTKATSLFGVVAVLQPLRWQVIQDVDNWLGENRVATPTDALVWLPPTAIKAGLNLDRIAEPEQAIKRCKGYAGEKSRVTDTLGTYVEELSALENAGAKAPDKPWCALPVTERRKLLARHGLKGRFTK